MATSNNAARVFEDRPAIREATPLLLGLVGPSGAGKTFSALRVAGGIQRVVGGEIYGIDTESRRMLHYADRFKFRHLPFAAPFASLDYLAAIEHCVKKGAKTIVVDSMSHEHEGPGGVLEQHAEETARLAALWKVPESVAQLSAWSGPKQNRRRMINTILQMNVNMIFCFRAKEKLKIVKGEKPVDMGFMPIAGEEFVYEMTLKCLLMPGAEGRPTWKSDMPGERMMMKLPEQFRDLFGGEPKQLDEDIGAKLADWAAGAPAINVAGLLKQFDDARTLAMFTAAEEARAAAWSRLAVADKTKVKAASDATKQRLAKSTTSVPAALAEEGTAYTVETASAALRAASNDDELNKLYRELQDAFDGEVPDEVTAACEDRRAALSL